MTLYREIALYGLRLNCVFNRKEWYKMLCKILIIGLTYFVFLQANAFTANADTSTQETQDYQQELSKIKSMQQLLTPKLDKETYQKDPKSFTKQFIALRDKNDLSAYEKYADDILKKWDSKNPEYYNRLALELCELLSSGNFKDTQWTVDIARRYALSALEKSDDIPVELELELTGQLTILTIGRDAPKGEDMEQIRRKNVEIHLNAWKRLLNLIDPAWDPNDVPHENIAPPAGTGLPGGVDPQAIHDPALRAEYEAAIEANRQKAEIFGTQHVLHKWLKQYPHEMANHFISIYSAAPYNNDELARYLDESRLDEPTKSRIINTVSENIKQSTKAIPSQK
jgi:hypothetical protein